MKSNVTIYLCIFFQPQVFNNIKAAIKSALWNGFAISWFKHWKNGATIKFDEKLLEILFVPEDDFCSRFILKFENKIETTRLDESVVYKTFYGNEHVVEVASKEVCALIDIALAKGGPEAIAESFYNCMRCQQCSGGQSDWVLTKQAKIGWCSSSVDKCGKIIHDAVSVYLFGDDKIKGHRQN